MLSIKNAEKNNGIHKKDLLKTNAKMPVTIGFTLKY